MLSLKFLINFLFELKYRGKTSWHDLLIKKLKLYDSYSSETEKRIRGREKETEHHPDRFIDF